MATTTSPPSRSWHVHGHTRPKGGAADAAELDNIRRWDGLQSGHYEVWYLTCNHLASRTGFWIRYTLESPLPGHGDPYAQLWFAYFDRDAPARNFALNRKHPLASHHTSREPFSVDIGAARLTQSALHGALRSDEHAARWDLSFTPSALGSLRQLPPLVYATTFADTQVLTPNPDVALHGEIEVDGRRLVFDGDPGGQTHLWGRKHAHAWAWGHCNAFEGHAAGSDTALETLCVRLKRRGFVTPPLTLAALRLDGEELRFNDFRHVPFARGAFGGSAFSFSSLSSHARLEGHFTTRADHMILARYSDPDGEPSYCANTEIADLRLKLWRRGRLGRFRDAGELRADATAHFEIAGRSADPALTTHHVTIG